MAKRRDLPQEEIDGLLRATEGVEIARVLTTVAGRQRRVSHRIRRDPDDPRLHVICVKDDDSGEYVPAEDRGGKRYVVRRADGEWHETTAADVAEAGCLAETANPEEGTRRERMATDSNTEAPATGQAPPTEPDGVDFARIKDVAVTFTMRLGHTTATLQEVLPIGDQSLIELDRRAGEPIDVLVNGRRFARGEVVTVGEHFGVRITQIVEPTAQWG